MIPAGILSQRIFIIGISISPSGVTIPQGRMQQLTVHANWSDGSYTDITSEAGYSKNNNNIDVSSAGLVTAVTMGSSTVAATYFGFVTYAVITVAAPVIDYITVAPSPINLAQGLTQQLAVTAHWSNSSTSDITSSASYNSLNTGVATVSAGGLVTASASNTGSTSISVEYTGGHFDSVSVAVTPAVVMSLRVSPNPAIVSEYSTQQLTVTATMSNGATPDVTEPASYSVTNEHLQANYAGVKGLILVGSGPNTSGVNVTYGGKGMYVPFTITA